MRVLVLALAVLMGMASPVRSQNLPAAQNPMEPMAWMVGGTWTADGEKGPDGKPASVRVPIEVQFHLY